MQIRNPGRREFGEIPWLPAGPSQLALLRWQSTPPPGSPAPLLRRDRDRRILRRARASKV